MAARTWWDRECEGNFLRWAQPDVQPNAGTRSVEDLCGIPAILDLEDGLKPMCAAKAPGADGWGNELLKINLHTNTRKLVMQFAKTALRAQTPFDMTRGWLAPLNKGKTPSHKLLVTVQSFWKQQQHELFRVPRGKIGHAMSCHWQGIGTHPNGWSPKAIHWNNPLAGASLAEHKQSAKPIAGSTVCWSETRILLGSDTHANRVYRSSKWDHRDLPHLEASFQVFAANVREARLVSHSLGDGISHANMCGTWFRPHLRAKQNRNSEAQAQASVARSLKSRIGPFFQRRRNMKEWWKYQLFRPTNTVTLRWAHYSIRSLATGNTNESQPSHCKTSTIAQQAFEDPTHPNWETTEFHHKLCTSRSLYAGAWFPLSQGDYKTWQAAISRSTQRFSRGTKVNRLSTSPFLS